MHSNLSTINANPTGRTPSGEDGTILFVPPMDPFAAPLAAAVFRSIGHDARVLDETPESLALGLRHTDGGECIPCPSTTGALIAAMRHARLRPEQVTFFLPTTCGPCRFGQYVELNRQIFERLGWGAIRLLSPGAHNAYAGLPGAVRIRLWKGMVMADMIRRMVLRARPYEHVPGTTDRVIAEHFEAIRRAFENPDVSPTLALLARAAKAVAAIPRHPRNRPRIGIVGEIYVRFNTFLNGDVCRVIESLGGEALLAPMSEWMLYTSALRGLQATITARGLAGLAQRWRSRFDLRCLLLPWERRCSRAAESVLGATPEPSIHEILDAGAALLPWHCTGEAILTLGRAALFVTRDGAEAIVNVSPAFCMPGTIAGSLLPDLESRLRVPVTCAFYDGSGDTNAVLAPLMHYVSANHANARRHIHGDSE